VRSFRLWACKSFELLDRCDRKHGDAIEAVAYIALDRLNSPLSAVLDASPEEQRAKGGNDGQPGNCHDPHLLAGIATNLTQYG
jgi:hypothetical protein